MYVDLTKRFPEKIFEGKLPQRTWNRISCETNPSGLQLADRHIAPRICKWPTPLPAHRRNLMQIGSVWSIYLVPDTHCPAAKTFVCMHLNPSPPLLSEGRTRALGFCEYICQCATSRRTIFFCCSVFLGWVVICGPSQLNLNSAAATFLRKTLFSFSLFYLLVSAFTKQPLILFLAF